MGVGTLRIVAFLRAAAAPPMNLPSLPFNVVEDMAIAFAVVVVVVVAVAVVVVVVVVTSTVTVVVTIVVVIIIIVVVVVVVVTRQTHKDNVADCDGRCEKQ